MGATLTEFLAEAGDLTRFPSLDALAAAAGLAPVLQQSGKTHGFLRRANGGAKKLKEVFYWSAFSALSADAASKTFYTRKRAEGKGHQQTLIALARRRVTLLHAMHRTRQPYQPGHHRNACAA